MASNNYYFLQSQDAETTFLVPEKEFHEYFEILPRTKKPGDTFYASEIICVVLKKIPEDFHLDTDLFWENYTLCNTRSHLPRGDLSNNPSKILGIYCLKEVPK
ncbi:MAG: hypothetical protein Terrestrivirus2_196 [Terrestrivirus sp.]|uniref:Uncharacterized protein n=1 Tax=Terrestrivirus sp. TaxID=2487775 RepID=A0A3G4ZLI4_9VIRU|nr:MAG: hypothetical protein Terrestrivirus2_196 [Terrestrivirus sp.]